MVPVHLAVTNRTSCEDDAQVMMFCLVPELLVALVSSSSDATCFRRTLSSPFLASDLSIYIA